jgi:hypothetical protein
MFQKMLNGYASSAPESVSYKTNLKVIGVLSLVVGIILPLHNFAMYA